MRVSNLLKQNHVDYFPKKEFIKKKIAEMKILRTTTEIKIK